MRACVTPPTRKSISSEAAFDAVSVTLSLIPVGVPVVFQVPEMSRNDAELLPEIVPPERGWLPKSRKRVPAPAVKLMMCPYGVMTTLMLN